MESETQEKQASVQSIDGRIEIIDRASGGTGLEHVPELRDLDNPPQDETNLETVPQAKIERMGNGENFLELENTPRAAKGEPPPADKPGIRDDPYYQTQLAQLQDLHHPLEGWTTAKRESRRQEGRIVTEIEQHFEGPTHGERVVVTISEDLGTGTSVLYDARSLWKIDPGRESQFSLRRENVPWDWIRELVRKVKTPEELINFLDNNPGLANQSREAFTKALNDWYARYHNITEVEEEEGDGEEGDGDNEDVSGGDAGGSTGGGTSHGTPSRKRSKDNVRDHDLYPDLIAEMLAALQLEEPELAAKVEVNAADHDFEVILSGLVAVAECRDICAYIAAKLSDLLGKK